MRNKIILWLLLFSFLAGSFLSLHFFVGYKIEEPITFHYLMDIAGFLSHFVLFIGYTKLLINGFAEEYYGL